MQRACVLVNYEVVLSGPHLPEEDVRMPGMGVFDILEGKVRALVVLRLSILIAILSDRQREDRD